MQACLAIRFSDLTPSAPLEAAIRARVDALDKLFPRAVSWRVTIAPRSRPGQRHGKTYSVHVGVVLPGLQSVVTRVHGEDIHAAVRSALDTMQRKLEGKAAQREGRALQRLPGRAGAAAAAAEE